MTLIGNLTNTFFYSVVNVMMPCSDFFSGMKNVLPQLLRMTLEYYLFVFSFICDALAKKEASLQSAFPKWPKLNDWPTRSFKGQAILTELWRTIPLSDHSERSAKIMVGKCITTKLILHKPASLLFLSQVLISIVLPNKSSAEVPSSLSSQLASRTQPVTVTKTQYI